MTGVGASLLRSRLLRGRSATTVADAIGVAHRTLRRWERGETSPSPFDLVRLADAYGVTLDELVGRTPPVVEHVPVERWGHQPKAPIEVEVRIGSRILRATSETGESVSRHTPDGQEPNPRSTVVP